MIQPMCFPLPAALAVLGFSCGLLAGFGLACFFQAKLLTLVLHLRALLGLYLPFRCRRCATLGSFLLLLLLQLSQLPADAHFLYFDSLLFNLVPLSSQSSR